jgi:dTDP-4-dehydrorhamnose 3,5-epimerase-like enzyme
MKTEKQFVNTLEDNIRECGALSQLLSDRKQVEMSASVVGIFRALHIGQWQISEPHQQHQNPCERRYQTLKTT